MINDLIEHLKLKYANSDIDVMFTVDRKQIFLNCNIYGKALAIDSFRDEVFVGISRIDEDSIPFTPHDYFAHTLEEALEIISKLVEDDGS